MMLIITVLDSISSAKLTIILAYVDPIAVVVSSWHEAPNYGDAALAVNKSGRIGPVCRRRLRGHGVTG
jgi:hypothetical protein